MPKPRAWACVACLQRDDPHRSRLLEQMLRNLVTNALKYTDRAGCWWVVAGTAVRCGSKSGTPVSELWTSELQAVFDEYHQIGNEARERERGLGLGLSIVQRLGEIWVTGSRFGPGQARDRCSYRGSARPRVAVARSTQRSPPPTNGRDGRQSHGCHDGPCTGDRG